MYLCTQSYRYIYKCSYIHIIIRFNYKVDLNQNTCMHFNYYYAFIICTCIMHSESVAIQWSPASSHAA